MSNEKKSAALRCRNLWQSIESMESTFKGLLREYAAACEELRTSQLKYNKADLSYMKKESSKNLAAKDTASELLSMSRAGYERTRKALFEARAEIIAKYDTLLVAASDHSDRLWSKSDAQREKFIASSEEKIAKADGGMGAMLQTPKEERVDPVSENSGQLMPKQKDSYEEGALLDTDFLVKDKKEEYPTPQKRQEQGSMNAFGMTSVNIAPISIDVSSIVREAVNATVEKLKAGLDRKIAEYVDSVILPERTPVPAEAPTPAPVPAVRLEDRERLLAVEMEEERAFAQLRALCDSLSDLNQRLALMSEAVNSLAEAQAKLTALQDKCAEEQRQVALAQSETGEVQKTLADSLSGVLEAQRRTAELQSAVEQRQKEMVAQGEDTLERQRAIGESQKAVALEQKKLAEEQKRTVRLQQGIRISQRLLDEEGEGKLLVKKEIPEGDSSSDK